MNRSWRSRSLVALTLTLILAVSFGVVQAQLLAPAVESPYPDCRFGVGSSTGGSITSFAAHQLGIGWYVDWNTHVSPPRPNGIQHIQTIRLRQNKVGGTYQPGYVMTPTLTMGAEGLGPRVQANPGAVWVIGNEPDRVEVQDDTTPQVFAEAYHDAYTFIKGIDPTARVAMPGLVEITPLRLKYLDTISSTYQSQYGVALPVDVWTAHIYILPEGQSWGAHYPVGIQPDAQTQPVNYQDWQHDDLNIFKQMVRDMRDWMNRSGYRNTPLLFTEFGILYPDGYVDLLGNPYNPARVNAFMNGVFDFFRTETSGATGFPADGNRLVQAWAWYSVADTAFNGTLFDPVTKQLTPNGQNFATYTRNLGPDLLIPSSTAMPVYSPVNPVTTTISAHVFNRGNALYTGPYTVTFYSDTAHTQVISTVNLSNLGSQLTQTVQVAWPALSAGLHPYYPVLTAGGVESNACNNWGQGSVLVASYQVFLPFISK